VTRTARAATRDGFPHARSGFEFLRDDLPFAKHRSDAPCLSIGLPVHDGERFLEATLDGLLSQTFEDFELIVADNASSDATEDICRAYAVRDRRIRYIRRPANAGVLANFNLTFEQSRGRYFKWAAADDIVRPEFVARCVGILESDPGIVLCHSNTEIIDEHDVVVGSYRYRSGHASGVSPSGRFNDVLREDRWCFALFGVVRSDALRTTRLLAGHVGSDRSLLAELALRGRFGIVADDLFRSRDHPARAVRRFPSHRLRAEYENPALARRRLLPHWRIFGEYARGVRRAELPLSERARCYAALARWLGRHHNWARLAVDPVVALAPAMEPALIRLTHSDRRWLTERLRRIRR